MISGSPITTHDPGSPAPGTDTFFAPAERASAEAISKLSAQFSSQGLLCNLLNAMPDWVMILNEQRQIVFGNDALRAYARSRGRNDILGLRPGELLACDIAAQAPSGCGTGEACRSCGAANTILETLAGGKASHECRILSSHEQSVQALDLRVWGTPLEWEGERLVLFVASDISSVKRRQVLERIFFHDVLNTAGNIQGIADLLSTGDVSLSETLGDLTIASESLVKEIKSQRLLLAAENGELEVHPMPLRSGELLEAVVRSFRNHPVGEGREVNLAVDSDDLVFWCDPTLLTRVLGNLMKNALEATAPGGRVTVGCRSSSHDLVFWCQNPGVMPRSIQMQIFQRSFSTKGSGRGLGTYSIKLLTERYLAGHVTFVSAAETGTVFTVTIPVGSPPTVGCPPTDPIR